VRVGDAVADIADIAAFGDTEVPIVERHGRYEGLRCEGGCKSMVHVGLFVGVWYPRAESRGRFIQSFLEHEMSS